MIVLDRLVDVVLTSDEDESTFELSRGHYPGLFGRLVVADTELARLSRSRRASDREVPVTVVTSGGAGGLVALARHTWAGIEVAGAVTTLRDLDDLAGNAARVVAAAGALPDQVQVFVALPRTDGWQRAVEVVEAAGLSAQVAWDCGSPQEVDQLSLLVEADLAFSVTGVPPGELLALLRTVEALVDGADPYGLVDEEPAEHARVIGDWDDLTQQRVRRRLVGCVSTQASALAQELAAYGLVSQA
ncbi:MAG TPA: hypothetical protein VIT20_09030 [Propionibacteriaceae bacterium]